MAILTPATLGAPFSGTDYNNNLVLIEASLGDIGPYVISGLVPSPGTGLAVNVTAGTALIGGQVTVGAFVIGSLTPSTTNHLYLLNTGAGTSNTTGTPPANSCKLGTALTGVATVTSVDTSVASGRQEKGLVPTTLDALTDVNLPTAAQGDILYRNATEWVRLVAGTAGQPLVTAGAGANPAWNATVAGLTFSGNITLSTHDLVTDTSTGTKIGTSTSQKLGFWGASPVIQPSALTQTYSTSDATLSAYTSDTESVGYTGIDNLQVGTPYAQVADLESLRVAYENLRLLTEDLAAFTNSLVDKLQSLGLVG